MDNGASHRGWTAVGRLTDAWPNARMVHLPAHASWLNQAEIYFSVIQRKLLIPDDFAGLDTPAPTSTPSCAGSVNTIQPRPGPCSMTTRRTNVTRSTITVWVKARQALFRWRGGRQRRQPAGILTIHRTSRQ